MTAIEIRYEKNQTAIGGPVLFAPWGLTWRDHLKMVAGLLAVFIIAALITYYNLAILYQFNPAYGRNLAIERAFCLEVDERFVSSRYEWSSEEMMCKKIGAEARNEN